jgi:uncharacterized protein HemX
MPVIPFAATVGTWLGASAATAAAVGGTAIVAGAALGAGAYAYGQSQGAAKASSGGATTVLEAQSTDTGAVTAESVETQAAQRKLARLSKYFTSPSGVLDDANLGTSGVF